MEMNLIGIGSICSYWILTLQFDQFTDDEQLSVQYERYVPRFNNPELLESGKSEKDDLDEHKGILGRLYGLANNLTGALVIDAKRMPEGYITPSGNDFDYNVMDDNWLAYLRQQRILMMMVLVLIILMFLIPLVGVFYGICCSGRRSPLSVVCTCLCWGLMLAIVVIFMLVKLKNNLIDVLSRSRCLSRDSKRRIPVLTAAEMVRSTTEHLQHLHVENYRQFQQRIEQLLEHEPQITQSYVQLEANGAAIERLSQIVDNLKSTQILLARLKDEVPKARRLATQFRDALRDVKRHLLVFLISQCPFNECKQFYRKHAISYLDMGCLHYDTLPDTDAIIESIESLLNTNLLDYPRNASRHLRQMSSSIKNHMNKLISTIQEDINDGGHQLKKKSDMTTEVLERLVEELTAQPTKRQISVRGRPAVNVRRKLGKSWFGLTLTLIGILLLAPLLILFSFVLYLRSSQAARSCLCCTLMTIFLLYPLAILLTLFFLVHGALLYHGFCSGKSNELSPVEEWSHIILNPNQYLPVRFALSQPLAQLRADEAFQRCHNNKKENLYKLLQLDDLYNLTGLRAEVIEDVEDCLHEMENSSLPLEWVEMHPQAESVVQQLLGQHNLSSYDSTHYTQHLCRQLVPEPYPGPLPNFWTSLDDLAKRVRGNVSLRNQIINLQAYHQHLGKPLAKIVNHMLDILQQIDNHLFISSSNGVTGDFAKSLTHLLDEIRKGDEFLKRNAKDFTIAMGRNIIKYVDDSLTGYILMVKNVTTHDLNSCSPLMRSETRIYSEQRELCNRIVKPMNGIWFGLFICSLLLLPTICCLHLLRCNLHRSNYLYESDPEMVTVVDNTNNLVVLPPPQVSALPRCYCPYHVNLPMVPETNVDLLPIEVYENQLIKPKRE